MLPNDKRFTNLFSQFFALELNVFAHLSEDKKKIYGELIKEDFYHVQTRLSEIISKYKKNEMEKDFSLMNGLVDDLADSFSQDFLDDFLTDHIFDNDKAISQFMLLCSGVYQEKARLNQSIAEQKRQEEEEKRQEEEKMKQQEEQEKQSKKWKTLSVEEIKQELKRIDDSNFDITQSYRSILDYELNVAKAQGLLSPLNSLQVSDMEIARISQEDIGVVIENALNSGINYRILRNIDEEKEEGKNCLLVTTTNQAEQLLSINDNQFPSGSFNPQEIKGHISNAFATFCKQHLPNSRSLVFKNQHLYYTCPNYNSHKSEAEKELLSAYHHFQKEANDPENISHINCALTIPYLRPLIPILQKLQEAGIDYYLTPLDDKTMKQQATKKIYIDRKNLPLYQEKIHPVLSTSDLGEILIEDETIDFSKLIWQDTDIPLINKEKEKQSYLTLTEAQMRNAIKQLDDDSHDCTDSYQDILNYEKEVAKARGLLTEKEEVNTDDVELFRCSKDDLWRMMKVAQKNVLRCSFFPEVDDNPEDSVLIATTKGKQKLFNLPSLEHYYNYSQLPIPGTYGNSFYEYLQQSIPSSYQNRIYYNDKHILLEDTKNGTKEKKTKKRQFQDILKTVYKKVENTPTSPQDIEDIKVALEFSYLRPMIPILEKLKEAGIDYYLPPVDKKTKKYNPTKQIYLDRKDLDLYKKMIHPEISTTEKGIIKLKGESITTASLICEGTDISFLEEKEETKE